MQQADFYHPEQGCLEQSEGIHYNDTLFFMTTKRPNMTLPDKNHNWYALIALLIIPISGISVDIYLPSLPAISHYFNVDKSLAKLSVTAYMLGMGIMQLFAGGISDSFGRKKPFLIAMALFITATFIIPLSHDIYQLIILRIAQGILVAVIMVSMRAVIPDLFKGDRFNVMTTYMVMAWSIGPIIAPAIGGYLQYYLGWQANFYFLASYGLLAFLIVLIYLPETTPSYHLFHVTMIVTRYKRILSYKHFLSAVIMDGLLYSLVLLFAVLGPFLIQTGLGYSAVQFGHIALLIGLAWFAGATTSRLLVNIALDIKSKICLWCMFLTALLMAVSTAFISMNIYFLIAPLLLIIGLAAILFPRYAARSISLFPETTGSANALFGAFVYMIAGAVSALGSFLKSTNQLPLSIAYLCIIIICLSMSYCIFRIPRPAS